MIFRPSVRLSVTMNCVSMSLYFHYIVFRPSVRLSVTTLHSMPKSNVHGQNWPHILVRYKAKCAKPTYNPPHSNPQLWEDLPFAWTIFHWYNCEDHSHSLCCIWISPRPTSPLEGFWQVHYLMQDWFWQNWGLLNIDAASEKRKSD